MLFFYGQYTYTIVRCTERLTSNGTSGSLLLVTFFAWIFKNDLRVSCSKCSCLLKSRAREWQMFPLLCNVGRTATWRFLINGCWVFDRRRNPCKIPNWYILSCGVFSLPPTAARRLNTGSSLVCEHTGSPSNDGILKNLTCVNKYISLHITLERNFNRKNAILMCY